jgi:uncharacterized protein YkwD
MLAENIHGFARSWASACAEHQFGVLDPLEVRASEMLAAANWNPFALRATVRREWSIESLARIAQAAQSLVDGDMCFIAMLPRDLPLDDLQLACEVISTQSAAFKARSLHAILHDVPAVGDVCTTRFASALATRLGSQRWVPCESEYMGLRRETLSLAELIQQIRKNSGLGPLIWDEKLARCATLHAMDMSNRGYMGHITPDGATPEMRLERLGAKAQSLGENLALGTDSPTEIFGRWMGSTVHSMNVLGRYTRFGLCIAAAERDGSGVGNLNPSCAALFDSSP